MYFTTIYTYHDTENIIGIITIIFITEIIHFPLSGTYPQTKGTTKNYTFVHMHFSIKYVVHMVHYIYCICIPQCICYTHNIVKILDVLHLKVDVHLLFKCTTYFLHMYHCNKYYYIHMYTVC